MSKSSRAKGALPPRISIEINGVSYTELARDVRLYSADSLVTALLQADDGTYFYARIRLLSAEERSDSGTRAKGTTFEEPANEPGVVADVFQCNGVGYAIRFGPIDSDYALDLWRSLEVKLVQPPA